MTEPELSLKCQQSPLEEVRVAGEAIAEEADAETVEAVVEAVEDPVVRVATVPPEGPDTALTLLPVAVTTTIGGELPHGSAWPHCHAHGRTRLAPGLRRKKRNEDLTSSTTKT